MHASTVVVRLDRWQTCFRAGTSNVSKPERLKHVLIICPRLTFVCFAIVARNITNQFAGHEVFYEKNAFAIFANSSISHTQMGCKLGCEVFTQNNDRGRQLQ